jgi:hypothetical protein
MVTAAKDMSTTVIATRSARRMAVVDRSRGLAIAPPAVTAEVLRISHPYTGVDL